MNIGELYHQRILIERVLDKMKKRKGAIDPSIIIFVQTLEKENVIASL